MDDLPPEFWQGVAEFNQGQYYACHDTLEALWMEATDPPKSLYQGILQISVACYHLGKKNWQGAVILLGEGIGRLQAYEPVFAEVNVETFVDASANLLECLQQSGPEQVSMFSQLVLSTNQPSQAMQQSMVIGRTRVVLPQITRVSDCP
ncbi:DUF309 domain-containing protein [Acaryochloris sp. IP29b_bin.148]|uniref:DUF309 domain-containing protein n=1 Tax=Acaryochloris sp. IP29b_bin.148 TaxID=2969218 RepID=UPI0026061C41|nr:DUF309 domain-containing protein [Acaryochloris sp. IP29b_bin.148]